MDQIYPDDGLVEILQSVVAPNLIWHLFSNNLVPDISNQRSDFTESAWSGYAPITVPSSAFTFQQVAAHVGEVVSPNISFPNTSGNVQLVYGYFVTGPSGLRIIACARFDNAPVAVPDGQSLQVSPGIANYSGLQR